MRSPTINPSSLSRTGKSQLACKHVRGYPNHYAFVVSGRERGGAELWPQSWELGLAACEKGVRHQKIIRHWARNAGTAFLQDCNYL